MIKVRHYESKEYVLPLQVNQIQIKFEILCGDVESVSIVYWKRFNEKNSQQLILENYAFDEKSPYYDVLISLEENLRYLKYYFVIKTNNNSYYYSKSGLSETIPNRPFEYQYLNSLDCHLVPDWVKGRIGYHIFPDRFFRNKNDNDYLADWNELPDREKVYGGTLSGIKEKLPYLKEIGISLLILMPIFKATSNHKYDTVDYYEIDPNYGSKADLIALVEAAHQLDINVVLDGVFNHIGFYSPIFQDVIKNQKESKYFDWFIIEGKELDIDRFNYLAVGDYKWMPKLNYQSESLREYIIDVAKYWIDIAKIDGWRLDVFDEIPEEFRIEFSQALKKHQPEVFLISETWNDGFEYLKNNQVHSIMNYLYRDAILDFFIYEQIDVQCFTKKIEWLMFRYPSVLQQLLYNLLGSHDTPRIMTLANNDIQKVINAYTFLLTTPGLPVIYYGDELGMEGEGDPDCRRTFNWSQLGSEFHLMITGLLKMRNASLALKTGIMKHVQLKTGVYSYLRIHDNEAVLILYNTLNEEVVIDLSEKTDFKQYLPEVIRLKSKNYQIINLRLKPLI